MNYFHCRGVFWFVPLRSHSLGSTSIKDLIIPKPWFLSACLLHMYIYVCTHLNSDLCCLASSNRLVLSQNLSFWSNPTCHAHLIGLVGPVTQYWFSYKESTSWSSPRDLHPGTDTASTYHLEWWRELKRCDQLNDNGEEKHCIYTNQNDWDWEKLICSI